MNTLRGIRVVDFGHYVAGPLAALLLADQGAEVIHVDRPGALSLSERDDAFLNRGKRRVTLDLKNASDLASARALALSADVVIENFRPGVMQRLGLDAGSLLPSAPRLVYCSLPGFAAADPRAGLQAWEGIVSAAAGLYFGASPVGALSDGASPYNGIAQASNFAAFQAATSIVMALIARRRTGRGQRIEAPLFDGAVELLAPVAPENFPNYTIIYGGGIYACSEGHVFLNCNNPRFLFWLLDAVGLTAELRAAGLLEKDSLNGADAARNAQLRQRLAALFRTRTAVVWAELAADHHIPLARIARHEEWLHSEPALAAGAVTTVMDPRLGELRQPGRAVDITAAPRSHSPARHVPDADHASVLAQLPAPAAGATQPSRDMQSPDTLARGALDGVRVLDLSNIIAGPSVGRWLADFGAEVIKVNDPRSLSIALHDYLNRGKQSALIDVKSERGRALVLRLAAQSDVYLANFPGPTARAYGLDEASVRAAREDIVFARISCYGERGPWESRRGYEPQAQSCTGLMARYGGDGDPVMLPYLVNDYGTGILGAFAVGLALYARATDGTGQRAAASLAQTATLHQWGTLPETDWQRLHRCRDGWVFIGAVPAQRDALRIAFELGATGAGVATEGMATHGFAAALAARVAQLDAADCEARCARAGVAAMRLHTQREAMRNASALERGVTLPHVPRLSGTYEQPGITVHLSATPKRLGAVPTRAGMDLDAVLAIAQVGADERAELLAAGVISPTLAKPAIAPPVRLS